MEVPNNVKNDMNQKIAITVLSLLLLSPAISRGVNIRGARSCGTWVQQRAGQSQQLISSMIGATSSEAWLIGFMSGLDTASPVSEPSHIDGHDNESIYLWVDNYCKEHPLKHIGDAGAELYRTLSPN
jgi:hypothetical protein